MIAKWEELTRDEIAELDKTKSIVLLPTSATEQHGAHLPVGTDALILKALMEKMVVEGKFEEGNLILAPQLNVGKSNCHMGFAGTLTFGTQTYYSLLHDLAKSIAAICFKKLFLFNSHGGNTDMLNMISRDIRIGFGMVVILFYWWFTPFWQECLQEVQQSGKYGVFHAC